ncbi:MAG: biopolymer transporter ExbD [Alphaproteobacteria bacterium]|jgi:biopolymer transport protein ExbD|nr:biopolymer transporter ExbD [Alphaproteobacteria bacterium]MDE1987956.1 biopolymer transporter ExbD [Alphaproteobacteria bacterium]MDE2164145.1 biopolymer transporter ExbD [Alphaproteobacteria bacterium]MDE2265989.1 biopolymer transporter ExbD [Alphaproteobacteria bacterium]MDE2499790.1 biopolymer transporter ExbD [Alphaproteobacteria bacterium]
MAMEIKRGEGEPMMEINMTPLIDVMLVLLTLLIITLPIQTHAVKLDMPQPNTKPPVIQPVVVNLGVDFDGTILWNGTPVDRGTLDAYLNNAAQQDPQPEIHLNPNKLAKYDTVAKVLSDAQRLGVKKIGFTGLDQYMQ